MLTKMTRKESEKLSSVYFGVKLTCLLYSRIDWPYITTSATLGGVKGPFAVEAQVRYGLRNVLRETA
jgi:hypothetical protein